MSTSSKERCASDVVHFYEVDQDKLFGMHMTMSVVYQCKAQGLNVKRVFKNIRNSQDGPWKKVC